MNPTQLFLQILLMPFLLGLGIFKGLSSIKLKNESLQDKLDIAMHSVYVVLLLYVLVGPIVGICLLTPGTRPEAWFLWLMASLSLSLGYCIVPMHRASEAVKERERRTISIELDQKAYDRLKKQQAETGLTISEQAKQAVEHSFPWRFLEASWHSWKTQLYVRGHRLPASAVWTTMKANQLSVDEAADNWNLPVEAIEEIIRYCEQNKALLEKEAAEDLRLLKEQGFDTEHT